VTQNGFLVIADLAGYTEFLNGTKLDHAVETLRYLFNNILEQIRPPFTVSKLEGDAVFAFASEGSFIQGQTLLDALEQIYYGYSLAWERLKVKTDCDCNACQLTPKLDLKFAAHYGSYAFQDHGAYVELVGHDVNLVHRLLKNQVKERTGLRAYAYLTNACVEALELGEIAKGLQRYSETFPDVGEVQGYLLDLAPTFQQQAQAQTVYVPPERAGLVEEFELPVSPALAWDYLSEPDYQRKWRQDELMRISGLDSGRMGVGTVVSLSPQISGTFAPSDELIADWRPTDYFTYRCLLPSANNTRVRHLLMTELTPTEGGTHVSMRFGVPEAQNPRYTWLVRLLWHLALKHVARRNLRTSVKIIWALVDDDLRTGKIARQDLAAPAPAGKEFRIASS
jgi:hypothetical protein